ncbi:MAG: right-handed parallel beta-helix repeat-containing protein, partial [Lentisphaeria bacterium]|nr:right-handed parallel beta-helix repeat-containing protein [Lentisphaeria bacterium]
MSTCVPARLASFVALSLLGLGFASALATDVSGPIGVDTEWIPEGNPYRLTTNTSVTAGVTLTIRPGVEVQFAHYNSLTVDGTLNAVGTPESPITFAGTTAEAGWWQAILVQNAGSADLQWCQLSHAGYHLNVCLHKHGSGSLTLRNCTVSDTAGTGLLIYPGYSAFVSAGNRFVACSSYGVYLAPGASFDDNTSDFSGNGVDVCVQGGGLAGNVTWGLKPEYSFYLPSNVSVPPGGTLTIRPGTVVKIGQYNELAVDGVLQASGTALAPIHFTDWRDDTVGGDANHDGNATLPAPGWWKRLLVQGAGSAVLDHCHLAYSGYHYGCGLQKTGSGTLQVRDSTLRRVSGYGAYISVNTGATALGDSQFEDNTASGLYVNASPVTATGCTFADNGDYGVLHEINDTLVYADNTFTGNAKGCVGVNGGTLSTSATWTRGQGDPFVLVARDQITIAAAATLTIEPGVEVRFARYNRFWVDGILDAVGTPESPITFAGTTAEAGWWYAMYVQNAGSATLQWCHFSHAGYDKKICLWKTGSGALRLENCTFSANAGNCLAVYPGSSSFVSANNTFTGGVADNGVYVAIGASFDDNTSDFSGTGNAVLIEGGTLGGNVTWNLKPDYSMYVYTSDVTVGAGATLTIRPGTVVKISRYTTLWVHGTLDAQGTAAAPIHFTDWRDDTVGGDANHDGDASTPAPAWWDGVVVRNAGSAVLDHCHLAYAGYADSTGLLKTGSGDLTVRNTTLSHHQGDGLRLDGSTGVHTFYRCVFRDNGSGFGVRNQSAPLTLAACQLTGNSNYGAWNEGSFDVDARNCWWGSPTGPYHPALNAAGQGDRVSDRVLFQPWLGNAGLGTIIAPVLSGTLMQGDTLRFLADPGAQAPGNAYAWDFGDGRSADVLSPGLVSFPSAGVRSVIFGITRNGVPDPVPDSRIITVVPAMAAPDLKITALTVPPQLSPGALYSVSYTVSNVGSAAVPAEAIWTDGVYLSADPFLDATDIALGRTTVASPLASGASYAGTFHIRVNASLEGQAYLIVAADDGWQILDHVRLNGERAGVTDIAIPILVAGTRVNAQFAGATDTGHTYKILVEAGQNLALAFTGDVRVYLRFDAFPTVGTYDFMATPEDGGRLTVAVPYPGTWYVLVVPVYPAAGTAYTLDLDTAALIVSSVSPSILSNAVSTIVSVEGAGFAPDAVVDLLPAAGGAPVPASAVQVDTVSHLSATVAAGTVPAGSYRVRVTSAGVSAEAPGLLTVTDAGEPHFTTRITLPERLGYHQLATLYVDYANEGNAPMAAPLVIVSATQKGQPGALLTLEDQRLADGFWTAAMPRGFSNSVAFLAGGSLPGVLQPGENHRVPIYYAGWQQPWDFAYPPFDFRVGAIFAETPAPVSWDTMKDAMRPPHLSPEAWDVLFPALRAEIGPTWGDLVAYLGENATSLAAVGREVRDLTALLGLAYSRAEGVTVDQAITLEVDAVTRTPGLTLGLGRLYPIMVSERLRRGCFGRGWASNWETEAQRHADGTVIIRSPGWQRTFQPDSRGGFLPGPMNSGRLAVAGDGSITLVETNGWQYAFAASGRLESVSHPRGESIFLTYTGDRLSGLTHSNGHALALAYNEPAGTLRSVTDDLGGITAYAYDPTGTLLMSTTLPDGQVIAYGYHLSANPAVHQALASIAYPDGTVERFEYDGNGRLSRVEDGTGAGLDYAYEGLGLVALTDALGRRAGIRLDEHGIPITSVLPGGALYRHAVGDQLCLEERQDPAGHTDRFTYDVAGSLTALRDAVGALSQFTYDPLFSQVVSCRDAKGNRTTYELDAQGRLTRITDADGQTRRFEYDGAGDLRSDTNRRGQQTQYAYDSEGQLLGAVLPDGTPVTYTLDTFGNLASATDAGGTIAFAYDEDHRPVRVDYPGGLWLEYAYDDAGRRTLLRDQDGREVRYTYDEAGRLAAIRDETDALLTAYSYDAVGRLVRQDNGDGSYSRHTFDTDDRLTSVTHHRPDGSLISRFLVHYDGAGELVGLETPEGQWTFAYGGAGNLSAATFVAVEGSPLADVELAYAYDAVGNRISVTRDGIPETWGTNAMNQITAMGSTALTYDA